MAKTFDSTRIQVKAVNVIPAKATEVYNHVRFLVYQSLRDSAKRLMIHIQKSSKKQR